MDGFRTASLETMPRARYYQLKRMQLMLANQSEDCLYLNIYAPSEGRSIAIRLDCRETHNDGRSIMGQQPIGTCDRPIDLIIYFSTPFSFLFFSKSQGLSSGNGAGSASGSAVVVLIHGESYSWGAGHLMDGGLLAAKSRMIVVTLNYRLGILGISSFRLLLAHNMIYICITAGFLQTAASPTPGQARGKSKSAIPTQGNYGLLDISIIS